MADLREVHHTSLGRHPWETARLRFFLGVLASAGLQTSAGRVLDIGSGDAFFARSLLPALSPQAKVVCVDTGYEDAGGQDADLLPNLQLCRDRPPGDFDLVLLLDVLEHIGQDEAFLRDLVANALTADAHVLVSVPAWPSLFTSHDKALHHHRRYSPQQARQLLTASGLRILRSGGLFHGLLLPRLWARLAEALRPPAERQPDSLAWHHGRLVTNAVDAVLATDNALSRLGARVGAEIPGLSWWALCSR